MPHTDEDQGRALDGVVLYAAAVRGLLLRQQTLYFLLLPQGQASLRPIFGPVRTMVRGFSTGDVEVLKSDE